MVEGLSHLLVLQDRDLRLLRLERELIAAPSEENQINARLQSQLTRFDQLKNAARQLESARKQLELDTAAKRTLLDRYRTQQMQTKKNDEYQALANEIQRTQAEISELEDRQLELMERQEQAARDLEAEKAVVASAEKQAATRRADLRQKLDTYQKELAELKNEIAQLEAKAAPLLLSRYRRLLASKKDAVIVPVAHETTCSGCHMKLTQQTILTARGGHELASCENCGRILFWPGELG